MWALSGPGRTRSILARAETPKSGPRNQHDWSAKWSWRIPRPSNASACAVACAVLCTFLAARAKPAKRRPLGSLHGIKQPKYCWKAPQVNALMARLLHSFDTVMSTYLFRCSFLTTRLPSMVVRRTPRGATSSTCGFLQVAGVAKSLRQ